MSATEGLPTRNASQEVRLRLVHSVEQPEMYQEMEAYGDWLMEQVRVIPEGADKAATIEDLTTVVSAGGLFEDYALPINFMRAYKKADELVKLGEDSVSYLESLENVYDEFGGNEDSLDRQHPVIYLLDRLMGHVRSTRDMNKREILVGTYRRTLVITDSLLKSQL